MGGTPWMEASSPVSTALACSSQKASDMPEGRAGQGSLPQRGMTPPSTPPSLQAALLQCEGLKAPAPSGYCHSHPGPCPWAHYLEFRWENSLGEVPGLTLLAPCVAVEQGVEQQLERGRRPQVVEQLQDVRLRQESFASIECLGKGTGWLRAPPGPSDGASPLPLTPSRRPLPQFRA